MNNLADSLISQAMKNEYFHLEGYMNRYWLYPFDPDGMNIRIHEILSSDKDRHMHDHPWPSTSIILRQGYWEWLPDDQDQHPELDPMCCHRVWRAPGDVITRKATDRHYIELVEAESGRELPSWSMFIMGNLEQKWGFYTEKGKEYWRDYLNDYTTKTANDY